MKRTNAFGRLIFGLLMAGPGLIPSGLAQQPFQKALRDFENVSVTSPANGTAVGRVYYEQRLYRNPLRGLEKLAPLFSEGTEFVPLYQGVPVARYRLASSVETVLFLRSERKKLRNTVPFDRTRYKLDFRLQPEFMAQFGYREHPLQSKTNLLLQSQLYLRRGLVLNWGIVFPLVNDVDNQGLGVRPAPVFLNQFLALDQANYLSVSAGLFYTDRYGLNGQYRHANLTQPWSFGLELGVTGGYYFGRGELTYSRPSEVLVQADVAYRLPVHDVTLKLSGGQYLFQDRGVRLDFIRQFGSVDIGFYVAKTGNGSTAGFNFAIPVPPGRIVQTQRVRLRSSEEFRWEYAYTRGYTIGSRYRVGYQLDALLRQYHQDYLRNQLRN